jgi:hypothetical protein
LQELSAQKISAFDTACCEKGKFASQAIIATELKGLRKFLSSRLEISLALIMP